MNQTKKNGNWKRKMEPYAFLVPLVLILFLFLVIPLVKAAIMSFQYYYVTKPSPNGHYFVGLENYGKVLQDEYFFNSVKVTLIYIVVTVAGRYIIGFITALLLNTKFLGRGLARALIIIPWAVPEVVACLVWILMYDKDYGIINFLLNNAGILSHNIAYLQDVSVALPAAMVVNIWKGFPYVAIMLLAGIVLGGFMGQLAEGISWLNWLNFGQSFGLDSPLVINFGILVITFGLTIKITMASIIGVAVALIIYRYI